MLASELKQPARSRVYNEAVREALIVLWEAAGRICGKRLKQITPVLLDAIHRHHHLNLDPEVRSRLLTMSAATMDRVLRPIRERSKMGSRRRTACTALRKSIPIRTSGGWNDPRPGFFEMDSRSRSGAGADRLFDTGFTALQTLFTGTIAKVACRIAIVIGGYEFAQGDPGATNWCL